MKPRYIDANVILPMLTGKANTMADKHGVKLGEPWLLSYDDIKEVIDKIPTANFKNNDMLRGEWIETHKTNSFGEEVICFECNKCRQYKLPIIRTFVTEKLDVCPNCGAKMNLKGANDAGARVVE